MRINLGDQLTSSLENPVITEFNKYLTEATNQITQDSIIQMQANFASQMQSMMESIMQMFENLP
jgi:hypothetical protein